MQRITTAVLAAVFAVVLWSGCNVESVAPDNTPKTITTTVAGQVVDESGKPVQGAQIAAYGKSAVTNQYGTFLIKGVTAPQERCLIKVSKSGYFEGFRAEQPSANGVTQMRIGLMSNAPQGSFPASTGRTVTAPGTTASVAFPANGYVSENGTAYTGQVSYVVRHLNPTASNFFDFFAGDFQGVRADGSTTEMLSYGVLRVELHGSNGEKLNLADGKTATVSYPVPGNMTTNAPAEMPLWSFDEAKGMWKEEGKATIQGNQYVGTVSHFSEWNCDDPARIAMLRVHVTCGNEGVAGVLVRIGERTAVTDTSGYASRRVPQGLAFTIKVHPEANDGLESAEVAAGPYAAGTNNDIDLPLTTCPAYIKGDIYDCGDTPIDATVIAEFSGGGFSFGFAQNGGFRFRVKSGTAITLKAISSEGKESEPVFVPPLNYGQEFDAGIIHACTASSILADDFDLNISTTPSSANNMFSGRVLLTADGSKAFVFYNGTTTIVNTATGDVIRTITYSTAGKVDSVLYEHPFDISSDGSIMLVSVSYTEYSLYDANSGTKLRDFSGYYSMSLSPDGSMLAGYRYSNRQDYTLTTLDASTGAVVKESSTIAGEPILYIIQMSDFLTNSTFAVVLGKSENLKVLNATDFSVVQTIPLQLGYALIQSSDGSVIGVNNNIGITFYSTQSGVPLGTVSLGSQNFYDMSVAIAPSNDRIVGQLFQNGKYSAPSFFAITTGQLIKPLPAVADTRYYGLQFSNDAKKLVGVYAENKQLKLRIWNF